MFSSEVVFVFFRNASRFAPRPTRAQFDPLALKSVQAIEVPFWPESNRGKKDPTIRQPYIYEVSRIEGEDQLGGVSNPMGHQGHGTALPVE